MAIQINPVDFRGFSLGSTGVPQLPQVGALGLQAVQSIMSQQDNAANRDAQERMNLARIRSSDEAMLRQNIIERNKLLQQDNQFQQNLRLDKNKLKMLEQQSLAEQAYKNRTSDQQFGLDVRKQDFQEKAAEKQTALEQMKYGIEQLAKKKKEDLNNIGSFAAQAQLMLSKETDPTKANLLRNELTDQAVALGLIPGEQSKQLKQLTLTQFKQAAGMLTFQADKAKELQEMTKTPSTPGSFTMTDSEGNVTKFVAPDKKAKDETQKGLIASNSTYGELKNVLENVDNTMFGPAASKSSFVTPALEWASGLPGLSGLKPSEEDTAKAQKFAEVNGTISRLAMDTIKEESGLAYTDAQLQYMMKFIPEVGVGTTYTTFKGKSNALTGYLERARESKQKILESGIPFSPDPNSEYGKAMTKELQKQSSAPKPLSQMSEAELRAIINGGK